MLDAILREGLLDVVFQPICELDTGEVHGYEVLGRMRPNAGFPALSPEDLIEMAVGEGQLFELERTWRRLAIERIAELDARGGKRFFLNVDTRIVCDPRFRPGTTRALLDQHDISPSRIVFELSERDPALGARRIAELLPYYASQGFGIALDDLGTGHSSLHVMLQLRPSVVKLGRELCSDVSADRMRQNLVESLVLFALRSDFELVAEGIEKSRDLAVLGNLGVQLGQGFLLGRPSASLIVDPLGSSAMAPKRCEALAPPSNPWGILERRRLG
jgi:EAL domain-containing protein (putative c-di-GMP-specific phosphodiesterase class I)